MSRADDLAGILPSGREVPEWGFRQGQIVTWNVLSGANTVSVAGSVLTNVPVLNSGTFTIFQPGDAVLLVRYKTSWAILGRYITPGGVAAVGRYTSLNQAINSATASNFSLTTTLATKTSVDVAVPTWASVATVDLTIQGLAQNNSGAADFLQAAVGVSGQPLSVCTGATAPTGTFAFASTRFATQIFVTPGGTLPLIGQVRSIGGAWAANASNFVFFVGQVIFNSNVPS